MVHVGNYLHMFSRNCVFFAESKQRTLGAKQCVFLVLIVSHFLGTFAFFLPEVAPINFFVFNKCFSNVMCHAGVAFSPSQVSKKLPLCSLTKVLVMP